MSPRRILAAASLALGLTLGPVARAEAERDPLVFVADPQFGVETTTRTFDSIGRLVLHYGDALPRFGLDESTAIGKATGILGRALRITFLDEPLAELTTVAVHEVGGHGGRGRELGLSPTFLFYLPGIYRPLLAPDDPEHAAAFTTFLSPSVAEEPRITLGTLGGLEANWTHAFWINARIARSGGRAHYGDLLTYGLSKIVYADTFFSPSLRRNAGESPSDVAAYLTELQEQSNQWRRSDRERLARRLSTGYLWNLADPMLLAAAYGAVVGTLVRGERSTQLPLPSWDGTSILLTPRFLLSPFGPEQGFDLFLSRQRRLLNLYGRVGTSGLASYWGAGGKLLGVDVVDRVVLGAELDFWRQPILDLEVRADYRRELSVGVNAGLYADLRLTDIVWLTGKIAAKTPGFVMAQPIAGGVHGYAGLSIAWP